MTRPWRGARADARGHGERGERAAPDGRGERALRHFFEGAVSKMGSSKDPGMSVSGKKLLIDISNNSMETSKVMSWAKKNWP